MHDDNHDHDKGLEHDLKALAGRMFRDGASLQLASVTGSAEAGYVATLTVGIPA